MARNGRLAYHPPAIFFGLIGRNHIWDYTPRETEHIGRRRHAAATLRGPLPPWCLSDCWPQPTAA